VRNQQNATRRTPAPRELPARADVVVVGAGFAGLAVAGELARSGASGVVVLESGPDLGHEHYRWVLDEETAVTRWLEPETDESFRRPYTTDGPGYLGIAGLRERVGGRSLYWHGVVLPIEGWALSGGEWPQPVVADLTHEWQGGASLYQRVTEELEAWVGGPLRSGRTVAFGEDVFAPAPRAVRTNPAGDRWAAFSPLYWWNDADHGAALPPVHAGCAVESVVVRDGAVAGVRVRQGAETVEIESPRVVLAAGAVENSRLAMQAYHDKGCLKEPKFTGLVDKIAYGFNVVLDPAALPATMLEAAREGVFACRAGEPALRSNYFLLMYLNSHGQVVLDSWLMGEQVPGETGYVACEPDGDGPWQSVVTAGLHPLDLESGAAQQAELRRLWNGISDSLGLVRTPLSFEEAYGSPDLVDRLLGPRHATRPTAARTYSFPLGSEQHEAATTPLGSMLDDSHQFREVRGLFGAGPSTFPRTGAANPALTILALAKRLAVKITDGADLV
jgi:hypothetical protein